ncbi:MAG: OmpA family protein [bacterium]
MRNDYYTNSKDYINRWVVSYADFVTMLLALFMVMYAVLRIDNQKLTEFQNKMHKTFSEQPIENVTKYQANSKINSTQNANIEKILRDNISQSKSIKLLKGDKGLIIRLNNTLLFDEGSAKIKENAQKPLNEITKVLTKIDNPVIIEGHTDSTPIKNARYQSNWELATARATNIIDYIVKNRKISPKRLCAVGYGEYMPVADNTTISGRMLNRRVDIIVLDK